MLNKDKLNNLAQEIWKSAESLRGKFKAYQAPKPTAELLTDFWALEQEAVAMLSQL